MDSECFILPVRYVILLLFTKTETNSNDVCLLMPNVLIYIQYTYRSVFLLWINYRKVTLYNDLRIGLDSYFIVTFHILINLDWGHLIVMAIVHMKICQIMTNYNLISMCSPYAGCCNKSRNKYIEDQYKELHQEGHEKHVDKYNKTKQKQNYISPVNIIRGRNTVVTCCFVL